MSANPPPPAGSVLAIRSKKARLTKGTCPLCRTMMLVGTRIVLLPGLGWCHFKCHHDRMPPAYPDAAELRQGIRARAPAKRPDRPRREETGPLQLELEPW
jgi:hypothetical protein